MIFTDYWNVLVLNFLGMENTIFFEAKSWWKDYIYWLLKSSRFELFCDGKYGPFWGKKLMERWYLLITEKFLFWAIEKFLFWAFSMMGNTVFFLSQKVYVKVIFTWSFWAFHDIPGPGKYRFSCSDQLYLNWWVITHWSITTENSSRCYMRLIYSVSCELCLDFFETNYLLVPILVCYQFNNGTVSLLFVLISCFPIAGKVSFVQYY